MKEELKALHYSRPTPIPITISAIEPEFLEYQKICSEIGFNPDKISESKTDSLVLNFFAENNIPLYDIDEVSAFMNKILKIERRLRKESLEWYWAKLTDKDISISGDARRHTIQPVYRKIPHHLSTKFPRYIMGTVEDSLILFLENIRVCGGNDGIRIRNLPIDSGLLYR